VNKGEICSFCKKELKEVKKIFRAEGANICDQCAKKFRDTLASFNESTEGLPKRTPEADKPNGQ
jgi:ATP-dependent protease Clp ATPase subunit